MLQEITQITNDKPAKKGLKMTLDNNKNSKTNN